MEGLLTSSCSSELFREIAPIGDIQTQRERDINTDSEQEGWCGNQLTQVWKWRGPTSFSPQARESAEAVA